MTIDTRIPTPTFNEALHHLVALALESPDHRSEQAYLDMRERVVVAEDYLVYALLDHITNPQGRGRHLDLAWREHLIRGLKSFRRFLNSESSGFLVQCSRYDSATQTILPPSDRHEELRHNVDLLTSKALEDLTNTKDKA